MTSRLLVISLAVIFQLTYVLMAILPESFRIWNFNPLGAAAFFMTARGGRRGFAYAAFTTVAAKLAYDFLQYHASGKLLDHPTARPDVYFSLVSYIAFGLVLGRSSNPLRIGAGAALGSLFFFLTSNFAVWLVPGPDFVGYEQSLKGLMECYSLAIPFHRNTFLADMVFTGILFGLASAYSAVAVPKTVKVDI